MLIGLMFLRNQLVYIQFHPVAYIVKLNIEMTMASLVVRLARGTPDNDMHDEPFHSSSLPQCHPNHHPSATEPARRAGTHGPNAHFESFQLGGKVTRGQRKNSEESQVGITCRTDVVVERSNKETIVFAGSRSGSSSLAEMVGVDKFADDVPLRKDGRKVSRTEVV